MTKKIFVLDTNVLLHDPRAMFNFQENDVTIPIVVIEELDKFKKGIDEMGRNARQVSRILDEYRQKGKLSQGVTLEGGGCLRVELNHQSPQHLPPELLSSKGDNRILATALNLKHDDLPVVLVTKDTNLRIKADALGLRAEDYETDMITLDELYSGEREIAVEPGAIDAFFAQGEWPLPSGDAKPFPNQFVLLKNTANPSQTALARYQQQRNALIPIVNAKHGVWGINARNKQQQFALDLLLNDEIRLVTLVGKAGTGKTLLALAAGLEKTIEARTFQRLVVSRPVFPLGKDIGFLPGDIDEKLRPWMQPIRDNLDFLMGASAVAGRAKGKKDLQSLFDLGMIEVEPLTYIRGRSMPNQYLIVDEAQNLTPHEIKTIITRAGEGTKIVLTGDPYQIDNPYIDSSSNGLSFVVERFKEETIAGHITLVKGERSDLAELAATLL
ncbi:MAG TPA: PhoH family protein [Nitrospirota bacterium]|nr:PhoH family protein [Nitrospirota bacterium]